MRTLLAALALSISLVSPVHAEGVSVAPTDSMQTVLAAQKGRTVSLRLAGGQELTGVVRETTGALVVLGALSGREFFDAVVPLQSIEALLVRVK